MKRSTLRQASLAAGFCLAVWACSAEREPAHGQLMVAVETDMSVPKDVTHIRIDVRVNSALVYQYDFFIAPDGQFHLPGTLAVVAGAQDHPVVSVEVIGIRALASGQKQARTFAKAVTTVPKSRIALLRVPVQWLCDGSALDLGDDSFASSCPPVDGKEAACLAGSCAPVDIPEDSLPSYTPELVYGGGSGPNAGGTCFDTVACFLAAQSVTPEGDCTLSVANGAPGLNLALAIAPGGDGICSTDASADCLVPLDLDDRTGFRYRAVADGAPRVIELPPAVCSALAQGRAKALRSSDSCATKTAQTPTCGPWSSVSMSGGADASTPDSGGLPDAGMPDASMPDASMSDAGMPDASPSDAGAPDAMMGDASSPGDAGPDGAPDTGAPDAWVDPDPLTPCGDPVIVSDPALDALIHSSLGLSAGAPISAAEAVNLTAMTLGAAGVSRLNGIQCFTQLNALYLYSGQIESVAALALLPSLATLELNTNLIVDPSPLASVSTLTHLGLGRNKISDPSSLAALTKLTFLDLDENPITDPAKLVGLYGALSGLTYLDVSQANLSNADLSTIAASLPALNRLQVGENPLISDVSMLATLSQLRTLDVRFTQVSDLTPLASLPFTSLALMNTKLTSLSSLIPFGPTLTELYVDVLPLANPSDALMLVSSFTGLQILGVSADNLSDISLLSGLTQLLSVSLSDNQIQNLNALQGLTQLNQVFAGGNQITTLAPLVANPGIGSGDIVQLYRNPLDCSAEAANIAALISRGVALTTDCP